MFEIFGYLVVGVVVAVNGALFVRLRRRVRQYAPRVVDAPQLSPVELPTVSVCIPARNEAHALTGCLERVLASSYEKLEIIVLDDNSEDDTSMLIKAFAHAGVRFIAGKPLQSGWIGKNHALDTMAREASGSVVLFMDVDTQIEPTTIAQVVDRMLAEQADALSVVPMRRDTMRPSALLGHMRYFWEVLLSSARAPLSSSGFWLIKRRLLLEQLDGFRGVAQYVQPEYPITAWVQDRAVYRGLIADAALGVYVEKKWASQLDTSIRTLYLLVRRSVASALLLGAALLSWSMPLVLVVWCVVAGAGWSLALWAGMGALLAAGTWLCYLRQVWSRGALLGAALLPYSLVQEWLLLVVSWVLYKRGRVTWKGRVLTAEPSNRTHLAIDE